MDIMRIIINKTISTPQHTEPQSSDPLEALLDFALLVVVVVVVVDPLVEDPVSLKLLLIFEETSLLPQFPQNVATSLFS